MEIDWKIDYKKKIATSSLIEVEIKETNKTLRQEFNTHKVAIGFEKVPSQRKYFCKITRMDSSIWDDKELLESYGIKLGNIFDENSWDNS